MYWLPATVLGYSDDSRYYEEPKHDKVMPATVREEAITSFLCTSSTFLQLVRPTVHVMRAKDTEKKAKQPLSSRSSHSGTEEKADSTNNNFNHREDLRVSKRIR